MSGLSQIGQIAINVQDSNRATEFYRDKLGMKHLFAAGTLAFFDCDGVPLMLSPPEKPEFDHPSSIISFKVDDIQKRYEAMQHRGVNIEHNRHVAAPITSQGL